MIIGLVVVGGALLIGVFLGALAGYFGGWFDTVIARITDVIYGLPLILGAILLLNLLAADRFFGERNLATVSVEIPALCGTGGGCTYTQGYWKTHVNYAAKPQFAKKRDAAWNLIDGAGVLNENAIFYLSGKSYIAVMWTPPAGNAYYILAQQYIAAKLNVLDGADATVIATQLAQAEALFAAHAPNAAYWKQNKTSVATLAELLAAYNEGRSGPPHCSISPATLKAAN
jgi:hypothetical protein